MKYYNHKFSVYENTDSFFQIKHDESSEDPLKEFLKESYEEFLKENLERILFGTAGRNPSEIPGEIFERLPEEILEVIAGVIPWSTHVGIVGIAGGFPGFTRLYFYAQYISGGISGEMPKRTLSTFAHAKFPFLISKVKTQTPGFYLRN